MRTIQEAKRVNRENGYFFFSPSTVRAFRSRVVSEILHEKYFIHTSVRTYSNGKGEKLWQIAEVNWESGDITNVYRHCGYGSMKAALQGLEMLAAEAAAS